MSKKITGTISRELVRSASCLIGAGVVAFPLFRSGSHLYSFNKASYFVFPQREVTVGWYKNFFLPILLQSSLVLPAAVVTL
jgi:ABC-type spermidine/putrescine transport system permease subunit II